MNALLEIRMLTTTWNPVGLVEDVRETFGELSDVSAFHPSIAQDQPQFTTEEYVKHPEIACFLITFASIRPVDTHALQNTALVLESQMQSVGLSREMCSVLAGADTWGIQLAA